MLNGQVCLWSLFSVIFACWSNLFVCNKKPMRNNPIWAKCRTDALCYHCRFVVGRTPCDHRWAVVMCRPVLGRRVVAGFGRIPWLPFSPLCPSWPLRELFRPESSLVPSSSMKFLFFCLFVICCELGLVRTNDVILCRWVGMIPPRTMIPPSKRNMSVRTMRT